MEPPAVIVAAAAPAVADTSILVALHSVSNLSQPFPVCCLESSGTRICIVRPVCPEMVSEISLLVTVSALDLSRNLKALS